MVVQGFRKGVRQHWYDPGVEKQVAWSLIISRRVQLQDWMEVFKEHTAGLYAWASQPR